MVEIVHNSVCKVKGDLKGRFETLVFRPLRNRKTFFSTMTVINGTLAFDVAGNRNEYKCVDIDPETIFTEGEPIFS